MRNDSASLRASIRSLLLPSFNRAALRGSQTTSRLTWGFRRSCNQAADVPSSKVSDRVPCSPWMNSMIVLALVSSRHLHDQLALSIHHGHRDAGLMNVHADILFLTHKGAPFR